ncbi:helical backbone metal receptor [Nitratidesulfovibrio liaohensis]|uniref:Helical backbone metal receptor n=1 Tax=Nitratidesulfovibrio liaohensis TaxID=2604158 RepID=A0ABY9R5V2_9BACT|nr:helical backbone metal receptor [Nitratidesulfovibrio liaohensis]WMW67134.1 helical backbone metal receptor [Nitratidesulfovibrio liaohensis]
MPPFVRQAATNTATPPHRPRLLLSVTLLLLAALVISLTAPAVARAGQTTGLAGGQPDRRMPGPVSITDDTGRKVHLPHPARRIVALYGAFNELLAAMDLTERIAARTAADEEPAAIRRLPVIGTHMRPSPEMVAAVAPDLVLQMEGRREAGEAVEGLRALGIPVAVFRVGSFDELFGVLRRVGTLTGEPQRAAALEAALLARLDAVAARVADRPRPAVFFEVRHPNLLAAGADSIVTDIIAHAGGRNCVTAEGRVARLSEEELLRLDPAVYLLQRGPMNPEPEPPATRPHYATLSAVRNGRVREVDEARYSRPGPRAVDAVEELARYLHLDVWGTTPATSAPETGQVVPEQAAHGQTSP